ncbi:unnamed protein product [Rhizophagus irregularis]|nr:unnamed protein product [Rhizophagus irregularis]
MFEDKFKANNWSKDILEKYFVLIIKIRKQYFALKSFSNLNALTVKEIVHELKLQREVDYHNNIIRFHGITKNQACAVSCLHNEISYIVICILSDVYSVGVLLWELSSGKPPFHNKSDEIALTIIQGNREEPVSDPDIPSDYVKLYKECWDGEPDNRPNMEQVTSRLRNMLNKNDDQTDDDLLSYIQSDHISFNSLPIISSYFNNVPSGELKEALEIQENQAIEIDHNNEQKLIDDIIDFMRRKTNEGRESRLKDHVSKIINQRILNWLSSNNQNNLNCNFLLGYFHYKGIRMDEDKTKAFDLFHNAENQDHDLTLYYLGICYQYGYGTTKDENSAFNCVKNDKKLAIDYYEKAANNGNLAAKYNLGNCYLVGKLVNKDVKKGFELIKQTAEIEFSLNGITMLGFCYHNGIGTQEDKEAAFKLYKKAANLGDKIAQYNLAQMYEKEDNTMKDINNAIRWYKESGYKDSVKRAKNF